LIIATRIDVCLSRTFSHGCPSISCTSPQVAVCGGPRLCCASRFSAQPTWGVGARLCWSAFYLLSDRRLVASIREPVSTPTGVWVPTLLGSGPISPDIYHSVPFPFLVSPFGTLLPVRRCEFPRALCWVVHDPHKGRSQAIFVYSTRNPCVGQRGNAVLLKANAGVSDACVTIVAPGVSYSLISIAVIMERYSRRARNDLSIQHPQYAAHCNWERMQRDPIRHVTVSRQFFKRVHPSLFPFFASFLACWPKFGGVDHRHRGSRRR